VLLLCLSTYDARVISTLMRESVMELGEKFVWGKTPWDLVSCPQCGSNEHLEVEEAAGEEGSYEHFDVFANCCGVQWGVFGLVMAALCSDKWHPEEEIMKTMDMSDKKVQAMLEEDKQIALARLRKKRNSDSMDCRQIMGALSYVVESYGWKVEWWDTGGGCWCIGLQPRDETKPHRILIGSKDGPFAEDDFDNGLARHGGPALPWDHFSVFVYDNPMMDEEIASVEVESLGELMDTVRDFVWDAGGTWK